MEPREQGRNEKPQILKTTPAYVCIGLDKDDNPFHIRIVAYEKDEIQKFFNDVAVIGLLEKWESLNSDRIEIYLCKDCHKIPALDAKNSDLYVANLKTLAQDQTNELLNLYTIPLSIICQSFIYDLTPEYIAEVYGYSLDDKALYNAVHENPTFAQDILQNHNYIECGLFITPMGNKMFPHTEPGKAEEALYLKSLGDNFFSPEIQSGKFMHINAWVHCSNLQKEPDLSQISVEEPSLPSEFYSQTIMGTYDFTPDPWAYWKFIENYNLPESENNINLTTLLFIEDMGIAVTDCPNTHFKYGDQFTELDEQFGRCMDADSEQIVNNMIRARATQIIHEEGFVIRGREPIPSETIDDMSIQPKKQGNHL